MEKNSNAPGISYGIALRNRETPVVMAAVVKNPVKIELIIPALAVPAINNGKNIIQNFFKRFMILIIPYFMQNVI